MKGTPFLFFRGSAPTLELVLPLAVAKTDTVYATFAQGGRNVVEFAMNGSPSPAGEGTLTRDDVEENLLLLAMTQADTLALETGDCTLQLRLKNDVGADTFQPYAGKVGPTSKEGLLE